MQNLLRQQYIMVIPTKDFLFFIFYFLQGFYNTATEKKILQFE